MRAWRRTVLSMLAVPLLVATILTGAPAASAAPAPSYPTWSEVKAARASAAATARQVAAIKALLLQLKTNLEQARAEEVRTGEVYAAAQEAYDFQVVVAADLQGQADAAEVEADTAKASASRLLAALGRAGGDDVVASLLTGGAVDADSLLYRLDTMNRLSSRSNQLYADALELQNTAQALGDQAAVAQVKREELRALAEQALADAQAATIAAEEAVAEQEEHQVELEAQLVVLIEKREATEADYQKGVKARRDARLKREAAARAAAAAAAAAAGANPQGWARPSGGYISSGYGMRYHPIYRTWRLHSGTDIAGQGCGAPIYSVHAGVVTYAGRNGTLGNYVAVDHGDGTSSGYGHIINRGILVRYGQWVGAGQQIARVGSTGASTGCHLHFMIRRGGQLVNPVPFMRDRGVWLG
jgi:murein DD-endopeptidase MepM/ murein hydrolase activator NlpD